MGLDNNVWLLLSLVTIASLALVGYNYRIASSCSKFSVSGIGISTNTRNAFQTGETVIFRTSLASPKDITWDFGDETGEQTGMGATMRHKFEKPGVYTVTATENGRCANEPLVVRVKARAEDKLAEEAGEINIIGNRSTMVGKLEKYISDAVGEEFEWKVVNKASIPVKNEQDPSFTFNEPGLYILQLTVDHNRHKRQTIEIEVYEDVANKKLSSPVIQPRSLPPLRADKPQKQEEKAVENKPEKPVERAEEKAAETAPAASVRKKEIHPDLFKDLVQSVVTGDKEVEDFDRYLYYGGKTKVRVDGDRMTKTFSQFCSEIRGKKITIENIEFLKEENGEIQVIKVKMKKRGIFGR